MNEVNADLYKQRRYPRLYKLKFTVARGKPGA